jgi:hypothetical protein
MARRRRTVDKIEDVAWRDKICRNLLKKHTLAKRWMSVGDWRIDQCRVYSVS